MADRGFVVELSLEQKECAADAEAILRSQAASLLLRGTTQKELEASLATMFHAADADSSGTISPKELGRLVSGMDWQLKSHEVNYFMYTMDTDGDGQVSIKEFALVAFERLVDMLVVMHRFDAGAEAGCGLSEENQKQRQKKQRAKGDAPPGEAVDEATGVIMAVLGMSPAQLEGALEEIFRNADVDGNGVLVQAEFARCISTLGGRLNLANSVVRDIFQQVDVNGDGVVEWQEFVGPALQVIAASLTADVHAGSPVALNQAGHGPHQADPDSAARRIKAADFLLRGMSEAELAAKLRQLFEVADTDSSGTISAEEAYRLVADMDWDMDAKEVNYFIYTLDTDFDGQLNIAEFLPVAFEMLVDCVVTMNRFEEASADLQLAVSPVKASPRAPAVVMSRIRDHLMYVPVPRGDVLLAVGDRPREYEPLLLPASADEPRGLFWASSRIIINESEGKCVNTESSGASGLGGTVARTGYRIGHYQTRSEDVLEIIFDEQSSSVCSSWHFDRSVVQPVQPLPGRQAGGIKPSHIFDIREWRRAEPAGLRCRIGKSLGTKDFGPKVTLTNGTFWSRREMRLVAEGLSCVSVESSGSTGIGGESTTTCTRRGTFRLVDGSPDKIEVRFVNQEVHFDFSGHFKAHAHPAGAVPIPEKDQEWIVYDVCNLKLQLFFPDHSMVDSTADVGDYTRNSSHLPTVARPCYSCGKEHADQPQTRYFGCSDAHPLAPNITPSQVTGLTQARKDHPKAAGRTFKYGTAGFR
jgi:Ca2+-binding EF-hand superfamily protein